MSSSLPSFKLNSVPLNTHILRYGRSPQSGFLPVFAWFYKEIAQGVIFNFSVGILVSGAGQTAFKQSIRESPGFNNRVFPYWFFGS